MWRFLPKSWRIPLALKIVGLLLFVLTPYLFLPQNSLKGINSVIKGQQELRLQENTNAYGRLLGDKARGIESSIEGTAASASVKRAWGAWQEAIDLDHAGANQRALQEAIVESQAIASLDYLALAGPRDDLYLAHGARELYVTQIPRGLLRTLAATEYPREVSTVPERPWRWAINYFPATSAERSGTYLMVGGPVYLEDLRGEKWRYAGCMVGGIRISVGAFGNPGKTAEGEPVEVLLSDAEGNRIWSTLDETANPDQLLSELRDAGHLVPTSRPWRQTLDGQVHLVSVVDLGETLEQSEHWDEAPLLVVVQRESPSSLLLTEFRQALLFTASGLAIIAILLALVITAGLSQPLVALANAADKYAKGEQIEPVIPQTRDEVEQLGRAFADMVVQRQESLVRIIRAEKLAAWRDVARKLAHEIKNPLQPIKLHIELLARTASRSPEKLAGQIPEAASIILQEVERLKRLADEFSEFARMPTPLFAPTPVEPLVHRVVELIAPQWPAIDFVVDLPGELPPFALDAEKLSQVLLNLLKNAAEALTDAGTANPTVAVEGIEQADGGLTLTIRDNGPGIPDDQQEHLFLPYFTTKETGTGLGLVLVQQIMAEHGGSVRVTSAPGAGAAFILSFPGSLRLTAQTQETKETDAPPEEPGATSSS